MRDTLPTPGRIVHLFKRAQTPESSPTPAIVTEVVLEERGTPGAYNHVPVGLYVTAFVPRCAAVPLRLALAENTHRDKSEWESMFEGAVWRWCWPAQVNPR